MSINYLDKTGLEHIGEKIHSEKTSISYTTYKDSNITIQDTVESFIKFQGLYGETEQDGTPTPSNPIDIDVVTGRQEIKVDGNNLLNTNDYTLGSWQVGGIPTSTSEVYRFNKPINVVEGETIYLSKHLVLVYDNSSVPQNASGNLQITIPSGVSKAYFRIFASDTSNFNPSDYMVSRYKIVEYEEYKGRTYEINLGTLELCDNEYIYRQNSKWYKHKVINEKTLNADEILSASSTKPIYRVPINDMKTETSWTSTTPSIVKSTHFQSSNWFNIYNSYVDNAISGHDSTQQLEMISSNYPTLESFKAFITSNDVKVYYELVTPIEEEITDTELIAQLEDLYTATYMNGTTYITVSGDLPIILNISYDKPRFLNLIDKNDLENYIKEVESKIDNIVDGDEVSY